MVWGNGSTDVWAAGSPTGGPLPVRRHEVGARAERPEWEDQGAASSRPGVHVGARFDSAGAPAHLLRTDSRAQSTSREESGSDGGVEWTGELGRPRRCTGIWGARPTTFGSSETTGAGGHPPGRLDRARQRAQTAFVCRRSRVSPWRSLESVWGSSADDVWAVGGAGTIRHIDGAGAPLGDRDFATVEALHAVWGTGPNDVWAVGAAGTILHWDGAKWDRPWRSAAGKKRPNFSGIWGSGPNDVWIGRR